MPAKFKFRARRIDHKNGGYIEGRYLYLNTYDYNWCGTPSKKKSEAHYIVDEHDLNLPIDPDTLEMIEVLDETNNKR